MTKGTEKMDLGDKNIVAMIAKVIEEGKTTKKILLWLYNICF